MSDFDKNNDGLVDAGELVEEWGWTDEMAQAHIDSFDDDEDGKINSHEFAVVMNRMEASISG